MDPSADRRWLARRSATPQQSVVNVASGNRTREGPPRLPRGDSRMRKDALRRAGWSLAVLAGLGVVPGRCGAG